MEFCLLADDPSAAKTVANWYFEEWCKESGRATFDSVQKNVSASINTKKPPLIVLCKDKGILVGAAELKIREMDLFPKYEFWLGGVFVKEDFRSNGIASALVTRVIEIAREFNIKKLYLQTEDLTGGLYSKFGFEHLHQVDSKGVQVAVMCAETAV